MLIDGRKIKEEIKDELKLEASHFELPLTLVIISVNESAVIKQFVNIKKKFAEEIGVNVIHKQFPEDVTTNTLKKIIEEYNNNDSVNGIVVQLPLLQHLDTLEILDSISPQKDVDVLSSASLDLFARNNYKILPPVVGAVYELCKRYHVEVKDRVVLVVGSGRLVGAPCAVWFRSQGAKVVVFDDPNQDIAPKAEEADIILSGAGKAGLIQKNMIKNGVVIFDAGASESKGVVAGDVDPFCNDVASLMTPVPGGIGPVTVAVLFRNLFILSKNSNN